VRNTALFFRLLGLVPPWRVIEVTTDIEAKAITIRIEWPGGKPADASNFTHRKAGRTYKS
jgi:hypothetical protein